jgi:hypothetical protein
MIKIVYICFNICYILLVAVWKFFLKEKRDYIDKLTNEEQKNDANLLFNIENTQINDIKDKVVITGLYYNLDNKFSNKRSIYIH